MKHSIVEYNLSCLYHHADSNFIVSSEGKLDRISNWNFLKRTIKYLINRFCNDSITKRVNEIVLKTFQEAKNLLDHHQLIWASFNDPNPSWLDFGPMSCPNDRISVEDVAKKILNEQQFIQCHEIQEIAKALQTHNPAYYPSTFFSDIVSYPASDYKWLEDKQQWAEPMPPKVRVLGRPGLLLDCQKLKL